VDVPARLADRIIEARVLTGARAKVAWVAANPGVSEDKCPNDQRDIVVALVMVAVYPSRVAPQSEWKTDVKVLRELWRGDEAQTLAGLTPPDAPKLVVS
jgi:hypothetical protein